MITPAQIWTFVIAVFGLALTVLNLIDKAATMKKNANEPQKKLEERVNTLEVKVKEHDEKLLHGNDKFRDHDHTFEIMIRSLLALIEFELEYCSKEHKPVSKGLEKAKDDLHNFLASR